MNNPYVARVIAYSFLAILLLSAGAAYATCKDKKCTTPSQPQPTSTVQSTLSATLTSLSESHSSAGSAAQSHSSAGSAYGGSVSDSSNFYVLPGPVAGSALPAGICQRSQYRHLSIGWNFYSHANGDSFTDQSCLDAILAVQKARYEAANPPRLPDVPRACIHPEPKKQTKVQAVKRAKVCA